MSVPALRFKEFSKSWQFKTLSQVIGRLESGVSVNSFDEAIKSENDLGILKTSCISNGVFYKHENKKIIDEDINRAKLNPVEDSILVSRMNTPQLVGEVGYISKTYSNLFIPDRLWLIETRNKQQDSTKWLSYQLTTEKFKNTLSSIATGTSGSMKNIAQPNFLGLELFAPDFEEQTKIANFLTAVDEKITQLTQKHDLLTQYKKGVMQQIFSQELRFKDDDGQNFPEWEDTNLESCGTFFRGGSLSKSDIDTKGQFSCVHYGELFTTYHEIITTVKSKTNITNTINSEYGDILMPSSDVTPAGLAKASCLLQAGVVLGGDINIIRLKKNLAPIFISYLLNFEKNKIIQLVSGTTVKHIYIKDIKSIELSIPTEIAEQTKIANFLNAIDDKITVTQTQLQAVKQFKQGLLQQMFV